MGDRSKQCLPDLVPIFWCKKLIRVFSTTLPSHYLASLAYCFYQFGKKCLHVQVANWRACVAYMYRYTPSATSMWHTWRRASCEGGLKLSTMLGKDNFSTRSAKVKVPLRNFQVLNTVLSKPSVQAGHRSNNCYQQVRKPLTSWSMATIELPPLSFHL